MDVMEVQHHAVLKVAEALEEDGMVEHARKYKVTGQIQEAEVDQDMLIQLLH